MEQKTLIDLFAGNLFNIPDYQRGYAWENKQWKDFVEDIDALISDEEEVKHHYTGTVVTYCDEKKAQVAYDSVEKLRSVDVVDGQQRLTTACLYLSVIIRMLVKRGRDYQRVIPKYLFAGTMTRLIPNNDTNDLFLDLLSKGHPNTAATSTHQKRLVEACAYFEAHVTPKTDDDLVALFDAITGKLVFTFYTIKEECEIGMTFELMNSRGKDLSVLELLKNYLMHWIFRNVEKVERESLTGSINKSWKNTYTNIGSCEGRIGSCESREDQCLRIAWTLYRNHSPKAWQGYEGFKQEDHFPLRSFPSNRPRPAVKDDMIKFAEGLAEVSSHYAIITNPQDTNTISPEENLWLKKIKNTDTIANFLPVMVAARIKCREGIIDQADYVHLLEALECYAFRVFLFEGKRSNAGQTELYKQGKELFDGERTIQSVIESVYGLVRYYSSETSFAENLSKPFAWYWRRHLLKYTLFEYELELLQGKQPPHLRWQDLRDSTLEHIYPQTPDEASHWKKVWNDADTEQYRHDLGNLVLTKDNSSYGRVDFERKKGKPGVDRPCYANSNIKQEREIASYDDWTPVELVQRRERLVKWIGTRWKTQDVEVKTAIEDADNFTDKVALEIDESWKG